MSQPNPYSANVNRAKTKKWVEAKSYSYDGDDWGEVDDYDEYGGYDQPEPGPSPKPTGLRQPGQSTSHMPQEAYEARQDVYQSPADSRQPYGNMGGPPSQQQYGGRSFTNPHPQQHPAVVRKNSFDRDDERRAFSAGGPQQFPYDSFPRDYAAPSSQYSDMSAHNFQLGQPPNYPVQSQLGPARPPANVQDRSNMEAQARYGEQTQSVGGNYRGGSYADQARQPGSGSRTQSMTSNNSGLDFHNRRDFSPSAMPPPLQTRGSPSPHGPDSRSSSRHPLRKSSLGQDTAPVLPFPTQAPPMPAARDLEDEDFPARDHTSSGAAKPPPFVRPADIYRRMQEEKEKERQSQDSSRPSLEAILGRSNEKPAVRKSQDSESSQRLTPALDPVTERKREYGMEGLNPDHQETSGERQHTSSKTFNFPNRASNTSSPAPQSSLGPMLPDVSRVSGFGESFFGSSDNTREASRGSILNFGDSASTQPSQQQSQPAPGVGLQHQPSLGFTSAVHQAFDKAEDQVPPTPISTQGSSVARSTSGGTSTVSPIISRGPSTATENWNARLPGIDNVSTPMIAERPEGSSSRPLSSDSIGTPTQTARKPSPLQNIPSQEAEERPPSFIPGYRRNSDTPSPDNSPRRTPALETTRQLRQPQEVELAAATPTDPSFSADSSSLASEAASEQEPSRDQPTPTEIRGQNVDTQAARGNHIRSPVSTGSSMSPTYDHIRGRTDSSSSSRVRNLADKFESVSRPGSAHSTTPRGSILGAYAQKKEDLAPPRPLVDHRESFRPHLPGGWESSASIAPAAASKAPQAPFTRQEVEQNKSFAGPAPASNNIGNVPSGGMASPAADQHPSSVTQIKDASEEAFAAVAAAGSALVGAFGAAVGMEHRDSPTESAPEAPAAKQSSQRRSDDYGPPIHGRGALHPEASRPHIPMLSDDEAPTAAPTPLPKTTPQAQGEPSSVAGYFSSSSHEQRGGSDPYPVDEPRKQLPTLPLLSTDTGSEQYESDRLRKEIVRELTPMSASEPTTAETDYSNYQPTLSTNPSVTRPGHESGVLPKEYESYWNDANSDDEVDDAQRKPTLAGDANTAEPPEAVIVQPLQLNQGHGSVLPASVDQEDPVQGRPQMLPHRFSWEQPLQDLPAEARPAQEQTAAPTSNFLKSEVYPDGHSSQSQDGPSEAYASMSPTVRTVTDPSIGESPSVPGKDTLIPGARDMIGRRDRAMDAEKEMLSHSSGLDVTPSTAEKQPGGSPSSGHIKDMGNMSPHSPALESLREGESEPPGAEPLGHIGPSPAVQLVDLPPVPPSANAQPKFPAFREILALKNPSDRIRAYNETRDQFANLNTGLAHWLVATTNDLPEHADLLASSGRPAINLQGHRTSQSRSKLGGLLPGGGQSSQQPYFQQYLNASPGQPTAPVRNASGNAMGASSPQGFSPSGGSGGKLSSQQVQAKGKDLLHTAGVFGGKANVAAKGLFSKGKSKLRAASGTEKATSRLSTGPEHSRGMQQQSPKVPSQSPTQAFADLSTNSSNAVSQASPGPQYSSQNAQYKPSQDTPSETPSVESFTQSQLGDDERSEESEPIDQNHPPRATSLYLKHVPADLKSSPSVQNPVIIGDNAPVFLQETPSADSYVGSPKDIHSPQSTTSSKNRTPTQASFANGSQSPTLRSNWQDGVGKQLPWQEIREEAGIHDGDGANSVRFSQPDPRFSSRGPYSPDNPAAMPTSRDVKESNKPQKQSSGDSKSTIRNVRDERELGEPLVAPSEPTGLLKADLDLISRAPARMSALAASEVSPTATDAQKSRAKPSRSRPVSSSRDSLGVPGASQNYTMRGPSIGGMPGRDEPDRPPSPISPYRPDPREAIEQRGRSGPVHYGLDYDFVPDSDHGKARSRSRSYTRTSASRRPSQDSRPSRQPSIDHHPAFSASNDIPPQSYSGQISREKSPTTRQQAPEYQVEGISPPIEWPSETNPRSRRGSKSSAFFRSLTIGSSPKLDEPPLPNAPDNQFTASPAVSPELGERKGKRASILRSLTGNSGSGSASGQSKVNVTPTPSLPQQRIPTQAAPATLTQVEDDEFPSRGNSRSVASKFSKRLQRSSTSSNTEQATGKKKRFSGIGSLFGRGNPKRQSSSAIPRMPSQQIPPAQLQQYDPYAIDPPPPKLQQSGYGDPDQGYTPPPPGGYYAPRPSQPHNSPSPSDPRLQRNGKSSSRLQDAPAYVQDSTLRQRVDQRMSPPPHDPAPPRSSATLPRTTPQHSSTSVPRASTTRSKHREPFPKRPTHESKPSGSSWTRFSQHGRSKSRQEQQRPSSNTPQQATTYSSPPPLRNFQVAQQPYHDPSRSVSPPPPPPPPKDEWHQTRPRESMSSNLISRSSQHGPSPSQSSSRSMSSHNRQSLPPLQINVPNKKRQSAIASGKTLMPEEKRKSRQLEIERSTISPHYREESEEEPPVVMSATSFPGQMWQPEYAHWDGD